MSSSIKTTSLSSNTPEPPRLSSESLEKNQELWKKHQESLQKNNLAGNMGELTIQHVPSNGQTTTHTTSLGSSGNNTPNFLNPEDSTLSDWRSVDSVKNEENEVGRSRSTTVSSTLSDDTGHHNALDPANEEGRSRSSTLSDDIYYDALEGPKEPPVKEEVTHAAQDISKHISLSPEELQRLLKNETIMKEQGETAYPTYTFYRLIDIEPSVAADSYWNPKNEAKFIPNCQKVEVTSSIDQPQNVIKATYTIKTGVFVMPTVELILNKTREQLENDDGVNISWNLDKSSNLDKNEGFIQFQKVQLPESRQVKTLVTYKASVVPKSAVAYFAPKERVKKDITQGFQNFIETMK